MTQQSDSSSSIYGNLVHFKHIRNQARNCQKKDRRAYAQESKSVFLTFQLPFSDMVLVDWLFTLALILAVGWNKTTQGLDDNIDNPVEEQLRTGKKLDIDDKGSGSWNDIGRMTKSKQDLDDEADGKMGKRLATNDKTNVNDLQGNMSDNLHGDDWHVVGEQEREGKCPGTREKVNNSTFKVLRKASKSKRFKTRLRNTGKHQQVFSVLWSLKF